MRNGLLRAAAATTPGGCTRGLCSWLLVMVTDSSRGSLDWWGNKWVGSIPDTRWHQTSLVKGSSYVIFLHSIFFNNLFFVVNLHTEQSWITFSSAEHHIDAGKPGRFVASYTFVPSANIIHNFISISIAWIFVLPAGQMFVCTAKGLSLCDDPTENYSIMVRALSSFKCPLANIVFSHSCFYRLSLNNKVVSLQHQHCWI